MSFLRSLDRIFVKIESGFLVGFLLIMILLAFVQVLLRNLFGSGFLWGDTLVRQMVLWAGFTGAAIATSEDRHISIDAFTKFISDKAKRVVQIFTNLFAAGVCYFLAGAAWTFLVDERAAGGDLVLSIPSWVGLVIIPVGYFLIMVHFILRMLESVVAVVGPLRDAGAGGRES